MNEEELMRKYHYGYIHSKNLLQDKFVKDLIQEKQKLIKQLEDETNRADICKGHNDELRSIIENLIKYLENTIEGYKDYLRFLKIKLSNAVVYGVERSIEDKIQITEIGLRIYQEILDKVKGNKQ